jgi:hypothetical protein
MTEPTNPNPTPNADGGSPPAPIPPNGGGAGNPPVPAGDQPPPPSLWMIILSCIFGGIALLFIIGLILLAVFGHTLPSTERYLLVIFFAMFGGLAGGFIGGTIFASGNVPIPGTGEKVKFNATGGIGALIVTALIGYFIIPTESLPVVVGIDSVRTFADKDGKSFNVQVNYHLQGSEPTHSAYLETSWTNDFRQPTRRLLDRPAEGQTTFELDVRDAEKGAKFWIRIRVQDRLGKEVAKSQTWEEKVPAK